MWDALQEDRLKRARQAAGWRWVGYGMLIIAVALIPISSLAARYFEVDDIVGFGKVMWVVIGLFVIVALVLALPGEKAAKQARELAIQKQMASEREG